MEIASLLEFGQMTAASGDFNSQTIFTKNNLLFQFQIAATWPLQVSSIKLTIQNIFKSNKIFLN